MKNYLIETLHKFKIVEGRENAINYFIHRDKISKTQAMHEIRSCVSGKKNIIAHISCNYQQDMTDEEIINFYNL